MEIKQHVTEKLNGSKKKSKKKNFNIWKPMKMETQNTKTYEMQQKQF